MSLVDPSVLDDMRGLIGDAVNGIVDAFRDESSEVVPQIQAAAAAGDVATVTRLAHLLKSSSSSVGATALGETARGIEMAGKAGGIDTALIATLRAQHAPTLEALGSS